MATKKQILAVMGEQYAEKANEPASTGQLFKLGDMYGQVWLADADKDLKAFRYQARKTFGSIICKVNGAATKPLTQYDVAKAVEDFEAGKLKMRKEYLDLCIIDVNALEVRKPKTSRKVSKPSSDVEALTAMIEAQQAQIAELIAANS